MQLVLDNQVGWRQTLTLWIEQLSNTRRISAKERKVLQIVSILDPIDVIEEFSDFAFARQGGELVDGRYDESRKAVTLLLAMQGRSGFRRWTLRSFTMLAAGVRFHYVICRNTADLLRQDGKNNLRTWGRPLAYLYGKSGLMRLLLRHTLGYFRPGFHPWQHDDSALAARAVASLSLLLVAPMPK